MKIVIALGGNALLQRGEALSAVNLIKNTQLAAQRIAPITAENDIVIVHGNGPQVGLLALEAEAYKAIAPYPFDILVAESQGMIGYVLQQQLDNRLKRSKKVTTVLTQVIVNANDPAFAQPTKFIGPVYNEAQAKTLAQQHGWQVKADGKYFRRVVASPKPQKIVELATIKKLLIAHHVVIAVGGGGIACIEKATQLKGVAAVIDKDLSASLLAIALHADRFIILTDIDAVYQHWQRPQQQKITQISATALAKWSFAVGSMQPKVTAACEFVQKTKRPASIGKLDQLPQILQRQQGTLITV